MPASATAAALTDDDLLCEAQRLARRTQEETTALLRVLMEVDRRRLYLREGCASLFAWCVQVLHLDEGGAYNRIEVARLARRLPAVLDTLERGAVTLTAVRLLAPHLTEANHVAVLARAQGRTTREIHLLVAELSPRPPVPTFIRRLASAKAHALPISGEMASSGGLPDDESALSSDAGAAAGRLPSLAQAVPAQNLSALTLGPPPPHLSLDQAQPEGSGARGPGTATLAPLSATLYKLQMTLTAETHAKIRQAQSLLRHTIPTCTVVDVLDRAVTVLVRQLERQRYALTTNPRPPRAGRTGKARHIPSFVKRAVWQRDEGQCAFVGPRGRCRERAWLEFHHVIPYAAGGPASVENISLRCRAHNAFEGEQLYGARRRPTAAAAPEARTVPTAPGPVHARESAEARPDNGTADGNEGTAVAHPMRARTRRRTARERLALR